MICRTTLQIMKIWWSSSAAIMSTTSTPPSSAQHSQLRLNPTNNELPITDPTLIVQNFFHDISRLCTKHLMMAKTLTSMTTNFSKQLHSVAVSSKVFSVLFNAAAMICAAAAAIAAANVIPMRGWARAGIGAAAAAASILFTALGKWRGSVLVKREAEVKKHKEITDHMIMVARPIMTDLGSVYYAARSLEFDIKSLFEAVDDNEFLGHEVRVGGHVGGRSFRPESGHVAAHHRLQ